MNAIAAERANSKTQSFRVSGGHVDRNRKVEFWFDGKRYTGCHGDTLASALLANGVRLVGRSFKYHRPRGILSAGPEEPNALVVVGSGTRMEPNTRATVVELYDGLVANSQNNWPSLKFDAKSAIGILGPVAAAGFYYKTFMWPSAFWEKVYEPIIRNAAGLGPAPTLPDEDKYEKASQHCDVLVVGAGAAGLAAALTAARTGARTILCEEDWQLGGRLLAERNLLSDGQEALWIAAVRDELAALPNVTLLARTSVFGRYDHGVYAAVERVTDHFLNPPRHMPRHRLWEIRARRAVICSGATERPIMFGNNDRPGVMLAGAVRTYLNRFAVRTGHRAVVVSNSDDAIRTAIDLLDKGVSVEAIIDVRHQLSPKFGNFESKYQVPVVSGAIIDRVFVGRRVQAIEFLASGKRRRLECDLVAMAGGWTPNVQLACHLGARPIWDTDADRFVFKNLDPEVVFAGSADGHRTTQEVLNTGTKVGLSAAESVGFSGKLLQLPSAENMAGSPACATTRSNSRERIFVDYQNDVTVSDIELAQREGYRSVEHVKRYTTLGMGTDQGKTSNVNALTVISEISSQPIAAIGTTTFRPPSTPVSIGAFAGQRRGIDLMPTRLTSGHSWAKAQGAVFTEAGLWLRAQYFPKPNEDWLTSAVREARGVRSRVGLCDVSTLGKIDIQGRDASEFLDRVYINAMSTLRIGRVRYGVMLREDGFVFDDGTAARLAQEHFVISTTTANAGAVLQHLEFCAQVLWPKLNVSITSVTEQWAQYAIAGPHARDILEEVVDPEWDVSNVAFPFMAVGEVTLLAGLHARLFRVSFSGELGYELAVPARWGDAVVRTLMSAGEKYGIVPYGLEALSIMRIEKGHSAGGELNGQTTARDLGLARMAKQKDFIGRRMSERLALINPSRPILVGIRTVDPNDRINAGAHFFSTGSTIALENDEGHMTSVGFSPVLNSWIGLGLVRNGSDRHGEVIRAFDPVRNSDVKVTIVPPCQFDPEGKNLRV